MSWLVTFIVKDNSSSPITGATVTVSGQTLSPTNISGETYVTLSDATYPYTVEAVGYETKDSENVVVNGSDIEVDVVLDKLWLVTFTIKDTNDTPITGATVVADSETLPVTDSNGQTTVYKIDGNYTFDVSANHYFPQTSLNFSVSGDDVIVDTVNLILGHLVTFEIKDTNNSPIQGATVVADSETLPVTDLNGQTTVNKIDGSYIFNVSATGYVTQNNLIFTVSGGATYKTVNMVIETWVVTFTIKDTNDTPIEGATVIVGVDTLTPTDSNGQTVTNKPNGIYPMDISATNYIPQTGLTFSVSDSDKSITINLVLITWLVSFTVKNDIGNPIIGAEIIITGETVPVTDINGQTSINLPDGVYDFNVLADGYAPISTSGFTISGSDLIISEIILIYILDKIDISKQVQILELTSSELDLVNDGISVITKDSNNMIYMVTKDGEDILYKKLIFVDVNDKPIPEFPTTFPENDTAYVLSALKDGSDYRIDWFLNDTEYIYNDPNGALPITGATFVINQTDPTCQNIVNGNLVYNGKIEIIAAKSVYRRYSIDDGANWTSQTTDKVILFENLSAGTYIVKVQDINNIEIYSETIILPVISPTAYTINYTASLETFYNYLISVTKITDAVNGQNGSILVDVNDSQPNCAYKYNLTSTGSTFSIPTYDKVKTFNNLYCDVHNVKVRKYTPGFLLINSITINGVVYRMNLKYSEFSYSVDNGATFSGMTYNGVINFTAFQMAQSCGVSQQTYLKHNIDGCVYPINYTISCPINNECTGSTIVNCIGDGGYNWLYDFSGTGFTNTPADFNACNGSSIQYNVTFNSMPGISNYMEFYADNVDSTGYTYSGICLSTPTTHSQTLLVSQIVDPNNILFPGNRINYQFVYVDRKSHIYYYSLPYHHHVYKQLLITTGDTNFSVASPPNPTGTLSYAPISSLDFLADITSYGGVADNVKLTINNLTRSMTWSGYCIESSTDNWSKNITKVNMSLFLDPLLLDPVIGDVIEYYYTIESGCDRIASNKHTFSITS